VSSGARDALVVRHPDLLQGVRERVVPDVVQQRRGPHHRALVGAGRAERPPLGERRQRGAGEVVRA
jgi:hypothetical protein